MEYEEGVSREETEQNARKARKRELRDYLTGGNRRGRLDVPMLLLTIILLTFGVVMVLSASYVRAYYSSEGDATNYFVRQLIFAVVGVFLMVFVSYIKMDTFRRASLPLLGVSVALLALVPIIGGSIWALRHFSLRRSQSLH